LDRLLAAIDQVLERGLAILDSWKSFRGFGDLVV
jgi:hypothetical protein